MEGEWVLATAVLNHQGAQEKGFLSLLVGDQLEVLLPKVPVLAGSRGTVVVGVLLALTTHVHRLAVSRTLKLCKEYSMAFREVCAQATL